ncbi:hypothetical protein [Streptomyces globosus]|uniref:hypothetical protein n=1 Tax=Streptomyces globosus TaxID=68209 RepID=UPI0036352139
MRADRSGPPHYRHPAARPPAAGRTRRASRLTDERLETLREAAAALAVATVHATGALEWLLGETAAVLAPLSAWHPSIRTPTPEKITDAEQAVGRLRQALADVAAA